MSINIGLYSLVSAAIYTSMPNQLEAANYAEYYQTAYRTYEDAVSTQQEMDRLAGQDRYEDARNKYKGVVAGYNFARALFKKMINPSFSGYRSNEYYGKAEGMVAKIDAILAALKEPVRPVIVQQPKVVTVPTPIPLPQEVKASGPISWETISEAEQLLKRLRYYVHKSEGQKDIYEMKKYLDEAVKIADIIKKKYPSTKYEIWTDIYTGVIEYLAVIYANQHNSTLNTSRYGRAHAIFYETEIKVKGLLVTEKNQRVLWEMEEMLNTIETSRFFVNQTVFNTSDLRGHSRSSQ